MSIASRLNRLKYIDLKIKSKQQEIVAIRSSVLKAQVYSDEPKGGNIGNSTEDKAVKIIDKTDDIKHEINLLMNEKLEMAQLIDSLEDPLESIVLRLFFINGYSWNEVIRELHYSRGKIQKARKSGIKNLGQKSVRIEQY